jgi:hypothetical protein
MSPKANKNSSCDGKQGADRERKDDEKDLHRKDSLQEDCLNLVMHIGQCGS